MIKKILAISLIAFSLLSVGCHAQSDTPLMLQKQSRVGQPLTQADIERFSRAFDAVRELYVDDVDDQTILDNAIQGMMTGLDPHSEYLNEEDLDDLKTMTDGEFCGLGIEITTNHGVVQVITPLDDSPAIKAGIKAGDYIVKVNGKSVRGMKLNDVMKEMRGDKGTQVTLMIVRKGIDKPLNITVTRDMISLKSVKYQVMAKYYGYIRVSRFQSDTGDAVKDAIAQLQIKTNHQLRGVILDLRNNPGGLLTASIDVSSAFLDLNKMRYDQNVVYTKGRADDSNYQGKANGKDLLMGMPLIVLVNSGSASAAEIVAGALQDQKRALIVGTRTFGKGSVQTLLPLDAEDKTAIKLTTARYYTPSGRSIQAKGIVPDIVIKEMEIPKTVKSAPEYWESESSLDGHLDQEDTTPPIASAKADKADQQLLKTISTDQKKARKAALIYRDYQLYEALNLLKGLSAVTTYP